jgi:flagellar protein FlbD
MITLRRLNGQEFILNADLIETIEATPDTLVTLSNGKKIIVKNTLEEIVRNTVRYRQLCNTTVQIVKRDGSNDTFNPDDILK